MAKRDSKRPRREDGPAGPATGNLTALCELLDAQEMLLLRVSDEELSAAAAHAQYAQQHVEIERAMRDVLPGVALPFPWDNVYGWDAEWRGCVASGVAPMDRLAERRARVDAVIAASTGEPRWDVENFEDDNGVDVIARWVRKLEDHQVEALEAANELYLEPLGFGVVDTEFGKPVVGVPGLYEFRVRHTAAELRAMARSGVVPTESDEALTKGGTVLLRVFFMTSGRRVILLLEGYSKGDDVSDKRETAAIEVCKKRMRIVREREAVARKAARRSGQR